MNTMIYNAYSRTYDAPPNKLQLVLVDGCDEESTKSNSNDTQTKPTNTNNTYQTHTDTYLSATAGSTQTGESETPFFLAQAA